MAVVSLATIPTVVWLSGKSCGHTTGKALISSFGGKTVIFEGESVTLEWDQQGASSLRMTPGGSIETDQRSISVTPAHSTSYLLTASSEGGSASARHEVLVFPRPPEDSWTILEEEPTNSEDALPFGSLGVTTFQTMVNAQTKRP